MHRWLPALLLLATGVVSAAAGLEPLAWYGESRYHGDLVACGDHAYAPSGSVLHVYALAGDRLEAAGSVPTGAYAIRTLAAGDGRLVLGMTDRDGAPWVEILDLADPAWPRSVARIPGVHATGAVIQAPHLYLVVLEQDGDSLRTYRLDGPVPRELHRCALCYGVPRSSALAETGHLLIAVDGAGLRLFDRSDPAAPHLLGSLGLPSRAEGVSAHGTLAAVWYSSDCSLVDLSDPWSPRELCRIDFGSWEWGGLQGSLLAFVGMYYGLALYDVSDPETPVMISHYTDLEHGTAGWWPSTDRLLITGRGLHLLDVADPEAPVSLDRVEFQFSRPLIALEGDRIAALQQHDYPDAYLELVSVQDPTAPLHRSRTPIGRYTSAFVLRDDLLVAWSGHRLDLYDVTDLQAPALLATYVFATSLQDAPVLAPPYLYALEYRELITLDLSDPERPRETSRQHVGSEYDSLAAVEGTLYLGTYEHSGENFLWPMDLADPARPAPCAPVLTGDRLHFKLRVDGNRLLSHDIVHDRLEVYRLAHPHLPTHLGGFPVEFDAQPVARGGITLLSEGRTIRAYRTASLPDRAELGSYTCPTDVYDLDLDGRGLVAVAAVGRIELLRVTDLSGLLLAGWSLDPGTGDPLLRAWTGRPGQERLEVTWDGLGTGVYLEPETPGWYALPLGAEEVPAGRYLPGLRPEVNGPWRPVWPHLEVER